MANQRQSGNVATHDEAHSFAARIRENVPGPLRELRQWLVWRYVPNDDGTKPRKVPFYPKTGSPRKGEQGSAEDRVGMTNLDEALALAEKGGYSGVGLAMFQDSGLSGVDLDNCRTDSGELSPLAAKIMAACDTYAEVSPSGHGLRLFYRGQLPDRKNHALGVETFCGKGYLTVTGQSINGQAIQELSADMRRRLEGLLDYQVNGVPQEYRTPAPDGSIIVGGRNVTLTRLAGSMRRRGASPQAIEAALRAENARCKPPLGESELLTIVRSIGRYEPEEGPPKPLPGFRCSELYEGYTAPQYIVKGVLQPGELAVVFGESGAMKSFFALDLGMHIGAGKSYAGRKIKRGPVCYIAGEGGGGMTKRVRAWLIRHGYDAASEDQPWIYVTTRGADLMLDEGAIEATLAHCAQLFGAPVSVIVFDTLAANFGSGDESKTEDMIRVMGNARAACADAAIVFVHHVGHADKTRERGSYALRAAADRRILVERPGNSTSIVVSCVKSKDDQPFDALAFQWRAVELGWQDADGDELTSLILDACEVPKAPRPIKGRVQQAMVALLAEGPLTKYDLQEKLIAQGFGKSGIFMAIQNLLESGTVYAGMSKKLFLTDGNITHEAGSNNPL